MPRIHARLDHHERVLPSGGNDRSPHLPYGVGHQVEHAPAPRLDVPDGQHRRHAERRAHSAAAHLHASVKRLPCAAAFPHPRVGLRIYLEHAPAELEHVKKAARGKRLSRNVSHDRAAVRHVRRALRFRSLDAQPVRFGREAAFRTAHFAIKFSEVAEDIPRGRSQCAMRDGKRHQGHCAKHAEHQECKVTPLHSTRESEGLILISTGADSKPIFALK